MTNTAILMAIEGELARIEANVADLRQKVFAALQQMDGPAPRAAATSPNDPDLPVHLTTKGAYHPRGFWFRGKFQRCDACVDIYTGLLRAIAHDDPEALPRTAAELRRHGRTRSYLATSSLQLFQDKTEDWARGHSRRLVDGWFLDINLGPDAMKRLMRRILRVNGLREVTDVVIFWNRTPVRPSSPPHPVSSASPSTH